MRARPTVLSWCARVAVAVVLGGLSVVTHAAPARAHGRFPVTGQIAFHPTDPSTLLVRATFGLLISHDDGDTWRFLCPAAFGARATEDPKVLLASDGAIVAAIFDGLALGTDDGCTFQFPSAALTDSVVIDAAHDPSSPSSFFALTSNGSGDNGLYRSGDDARTWTATNAAIDPILFETVRVAPSDASHIYLSGAYPPSATEPRRPFIYRSIDGGAMFESFAFTDFRMDDRNVYLVGVDPRAPTRLLAHVRGATAGRVYESVDGGETFSLLLEVPEVAGFAWSEDGETAYIGGRLGTGLLRSDDGAVTFTTIRDDLSVGCTALRGDELYICADNFENGFAVGRSTDLGATFEPLLAFSDIDATVECGAGSMTPMLCEQSWTDLIGDLGLDLDGGVVVVPDGGFLDGGVATDGGRSPMDGGGGGEPGGCACSAATFAPRERHPRDVWLALAVLGLGCVGVRRLRSSRRRRSLPQSG